MDVSCRPPDAKRVQFRQTSDISEDCDSFYGSDKETDDALMFSDDTEIEVGSSSSEPDDDYSVEHVEHPLDKVKLDETWGFAY